MAVSRELDIYYERGAREIYSPTTGRQLVNYWVINHLLARHYFDSNTLETTKRHMYPSDISSFAPLHEFLSLTCICKFLLSLRVIRRLHP